MTGLVHCMVGPSILHGSACIQVHGVTEMSDIHPLVLLGAYLYIVRNVMYFALPTNVRINCCSVNLITSEKGGVRADKVNEDTIKRK